MNNDHNDAPDDRQLHDAAVEAAGEAMEGLQRTCEEGIPQKAARLRNELFELLEATWLTSALARLSIEAKSGPEGPPTAITDNLLIVQFSSACDACLLQAIHALEPLAVNGAGEELDAYLDGALEGADSSSMEWMRGFFVGTYKDRDRDQQVERLNLLLRKGSPETEEAGE